MFVMVPDVACTLPPENVYPWCFAQFMIFLQFTSARTARPICTKIAEAGEMIRTLLDAALLN